MGFFSNLKIFTDTCGIQWFFFQYLSFGYTSWTADLLLICLSFEIRNSTIQWYSFGLLKEKTKKQKKKNVDNKLHC